ncbi:hypothetical protein [Pseudooceanicola batsensis]|uniref:hypothetical protein n=1 Tax=Pseudooceanicola batsensis TaxID=314255 RepID=UPI0011D1D3D0|nr:hypothetical protein [Pseudooceanicola batsensis]
MAPVVAAPGPAWAHSFRSGADGYQQFLEGAWVIVGYPGILLPLVALGLLLGLWDREGMVRAWPALIVGLVLGVPLGAVAPVAVATGFVAFGVFVAALTALLARHSRYEAFALAGIAGAMAMATALEGHGLFQLPVMIHLGLFLTANLAVAASAGLVRVSTDHVPAQWMRILWRIAASWIAAVLILYLAYLSRGA